MSEYICPVCSSKIDVSTRMQFAYCPVCTSKISVDDLKKGVLSKDLINASTAQELDVIIVDEKSMDEETLRIAADNGSVKACMEMASRYVLRSDNVRAKEYFRIAAKKEVYDAKFGVLVCELDECRKYGDYMNLYRKINVFNQSSFRYLSNKTLDELNWIVDYQKRMWDAEYSRSNTVTKSNSSSSYSEPEYQRYIPPVEESTEEKSWIMGCGICGSFCGTSYNS